MINLKKSLEDFNIQCSGIIHIGGHQAQEYQVYKDLGIKHQIWIEANPFYHSQILEVVKNDEFCMAYNYLILDEEKEVSFNLANNGQSSSVLPLKNHTKYYPNIKFDGQMLTTSKRLDSLFVEHNIEVKNYNGLVVDVQGVELKVLMSLGLLINNFKFIQSEVNLEELYEGCCLIDDLDKYLEQFGFERKITELWDNGSVGWGDAMYIKK